MSMLKPAGSRTALIVLGGWLGIGFAVALAEAQSPDLGKPITEAEIKAWDIDVAPNGKGLPPGSGTSAEGAKIYAEQCAACHKPDLSGFGSPGAFALVGRNTWTFVSYVEHATTLFDTIRRSMPLQAPRTLSSDEAYALTAYLLAMNKIIPDNQVMSAETLPKVKMPSAGSSIIRFPDRI